MANEFDAYREALVVEHTTVWPEEYDDWSQADRLRDRGPAALRAARSGPIGLRAPAHGVRPANYGHAHGSRAVGTRPIMAIGLGLMA